MSAEAIAAWRKAQGSLRAARALTTLDPDSAVSRAYYAAFHAVSALFLMQGRAFSKHTALEAAIHRDLVRAGHWPADLGAAFKTLLDLRQTGNYGGPVALSRSDADRAIELAAKIVAAVADAQPDLTRSKVP